MKPIIEVRGICKAYRIGAKRQRYHSLRESIVDVFSWRWEKKQTFWALQDLSFNVMPGECVGVIGRNGAGKSTLLKILSRITPPTKGNVKIRGRLASLLEVGTGFHPELTGRENIFFNGSILGLRKREIQRQFDAITDFSGVEQFLDTPLKHYSSGMQLRLAFAVAAHLEPEILLIDEVLAVGDAEFQKKCLGKMDEVAKSGRTVVFVSHNLGAVKQLCTKGLVLEEGKIEYIGTIKEGIDFYTKSIIGVESSVWINNLDTNPKVFLEKIEITNDQSVPCMTFSNSEPVFIHFYTHAFQHVDNFTIGFDLLKDGITLFRTRQTDSMKKDYLENSERSRFTCVIPNWFLHEGVYSVKPNIAIFFQERLSNVYFNLELKFEVTLDASRSTYHQILNAQNQPGLLFPTLKWFYH